MINYICMQDITGMKFVVDISSMPFEVFMCDYGHHKLLYPCDINGKEVDFEYSIKFSSLPNLKRNIADITCKTCKQSACDTNNCGRCLIRTLASVLLSDSPLEGEPYYEAEDKLVADMYNLKDTNFVWFLLRGREECNKLLWREGK